MFFRKGKERSVTVHSVKDDAHQLKDNVQMTRAEQLNDQMYISKHKNGFHGKLDIFEEIQDRNGDRMGFKKKSIKFETSEPIKNPKRFALDLRKQVKKNVEK